MVVVKRPMSNFTQAVFPLKALAPEAAYALTNLDTSENSTMTGQELLEKGLEARLLQRPDSALFLYQRKSQRPPSPGNPSGSKTNS